jgi:hypothetical protein
MGHQAPHRASDVQMSTIPPTRGPPVQAKCMVGDRVLAGICKCPSGEELEGRMMEDINAWEMVSPEKHREEGNGKPPPYFPKKDEDDK